MPREWVTQFDGGFSFAEFLEGLGKPTAESAALRGVEGEGPAPVEPPGDIGVDDVYTFPGFLVDTSVKQPGVEGKWWQPLYLDMERRHIMYLEDDGILGNGYVEDRGTPGRRRDILWVRPNTTVGVARVAQSIQGQFLSGQFTRAADFRDSPAGGTVAAATGVFCEGDSIGCCRPTRR